MAKLVFGMNQSLDGYVDHLRIAPPSPTLFRHFIEEAQEQAGSVYGRHMYEAMRYWQRDTLSRRRGGSSRNGGRRSSGMG